MAVFSNYFNYGYKWQTEELEKGAKIASVLSLLELINYIASLNWQLKRYLDIHSILVYAWEQVSGGPPKKS